MQEIEPLVTSTKTARVLGITPATLRKWRWRGVGPAFIKLSDDPGGRVMYSPATIREWIEAHTAGGAT